MIANWTAPQHIKALCTERNGGFSLPPFDAFNLAYHVGDDPDHVAQNRQQLQETLKLPGQPMWLNQTHSTVCVDVDAEGWSANADAAITKRANTVLAIMTADCLPIVLCNQQGNEIAAIHAGWRGLAKGIIDNTLEMMASQASECMAWIGPAICMRCYATGEEVLQSMIERYPFAYLAFERVEAQWYANLPLMAAKVLQQLGVEQVFPSHSCTFESKKHYYSYRSQSQTGRMATLIWFLDDPK